MLMPIPCDYCQNVFFRERGEISRNRKLGRKVFCSRRCAGKCLLDNIPVEKRGIDQDNLIKGRAADGFSMFRVFASRIKVREREGRKQCNLTLQDLKEQWDEQGGICPYTGWKMVTPRTTGDKRTPTPDTASLDRIDSSKGYVKGNVEFVCLMAQYAKNHFGKSDVMKFCEAVSNKHCIR